MYFKVEYDQNTRTGSIFFEDFEKAIQRLKDHGDIEFKDHRSGFHRMSFIDSMSRIFDEDTVWFKRFEKDEVELQTLGPMTFELKGVTNVNENVMYLARYFDKPEFRKYLGDCGWEDKVYAVPVAIPDKNLVNKIVSFRFWWELI